MGWWPLDRPAGVLYVRTNKQLGVDMTTPAGQINQSNEPVWRCRVMIAVPPTGFGAQLAVMRGWLDRNCAACWGSAPAGFDGVLNDAVAFYFVDGAAARAFVNRFCCGYRAGAATMPRR